MCPVFYFFSFFLILPDLSHRTAALLRLQRTILRSIKHANRYHHVVQEDTGGVGELAKLQEKEWRKRIRGKSCFCSCNSALPLHLSHYIFRGFFFKLLNPLGTLVVSSAIFLRLDLQSLIIILIDPRSVTSQRPPLLCLPALNTNISCALRQPSTSASLTTLSLMALFYSDKRYGPDCVPVPFVETKSIDHS